MDFVDLVDFAGDILSVVLPSLQFFRLWISWSVLLSLLAFDISWTVVVFSKSFGCAPLCTNNNRRHTLHNEFWKEKVAVQAFYLPLYPFHDILFHKIRANAGWRVLQILAIRACPLWTDAAPARGANCANLGRFATRKIWPRWYFINGRRARICIKRTHYYSRNI